MIEIRKRKCKKILAAGISFLLIVQFGWAATNQAAFAEAVTDEYIVIAKDVETVEKVKEEYKVVAENGEALTLDISESTASRLADSEDIICVEKDFTIEAPVEAGWDMVKPQSEDWNLSAIHVENASASSKVKVAILDSGVDMTHNIDVKERKNFIDESPVTTPLYEDWCGHGTSVASMIAGKGNESNVNGVNDNIELYSARILDENAQAPVSRVVEAIYWAIEKDVDIINISFGTQTYSEALETAVNAAVEKGILVIAAAGNHGSTVVDYPAAFENVVSVGSINAQGEISDFSSRGESVDVYAPGEAVLAQGNFGEDLVMSGTSLATPQVTGVAALLWSKDMTKSATFIKALLKLSANSISAGNGYGLVDYQYALQIYDEVAEQVDVMMEDDNSVIEESEGVGNIDVPAVDEENEIGLEETVNTLEFEKIDLGKINIAQNSTTISDLSDPIVNGSWGGDVHQKYYANQAMKDGAVYADQKENLKGIGNNPELHGFAWHDDAGGRLNTGDCNFMANYKYLVKVAEAYGRGDGYSVVLDSDVTGDCYTALKADMAAILEYDREGGKQYILNQSDTNQRAFVLGLAMHVATDTFAHSSFSQKSAGAYLWERIKHPQADYITVESRRYDMALAIEQNVLSRYRHERGGYDTCSDFHDTTSGAYSMLTFRISDMKNFAAETGYSNSSVLSDYEALQNGF
ncbi:MAG: S8 family serine peptidase [Eubacteriaceae bacterium]|nr:S8 family serine peptidase [Eubacteriaceae bacterium]